MANSKKLGCHFSLGAASLVNQMWHIDFMLWTTGVSIYKKFAFVGTTMYSLQLGCALYWWRVARTSDDPTKTTLVIYVAATGAIPFSKIIWFYKHRKCIQNIIREMKMYSRRITRCSEKRTRNLTHYLRTTRYLTLANYVMTPMGCVTYLTVPFLEEKRSLPEKHAIFLGLEPMMETPNYQICYLVNITFVVTTALFNMAYECIYMTLLGHTASCYRVMASELDSLLDDVVALKPDLSEDFLPEDVGGILRTEERLPENHFSNVNISSTTSEQFINDRIFFIIQSHVEQLAIIKKTQNMYSFIIGYDVFLLVVCLATFLLNLNAIDWMTMFGYTGFSFVQLSLYCFVGQQLIDGGNAFEMSLHQCSWEIFSPGQRKRILTAMIVAQRPAQILASSIMTLNHSTYKSVLEKRIIIVFVASYLGIVRHSDCSIQKM